MRCEEAPDGLDEEELEVHGERVVIFRGKSPNASGFSLPHPVKNAVLPTVGTMDDLSSGLFTEALCSPLSGGYALHGYLAHKKKRPPSTLQ